MVKSFRKRFLRSRSLGQNSLEATGAGLTSPPARLRRLGVRQPQDKEPEDPLFEARQSASYLETNRDKSDHQRDKDVKKGDKPPLVPLGRNTALNCEDCSRYFLSYHGYDTHLETHPNRALRCWICNIRFQTNRSLVIHHRRRHNEDLKSQGLESLEFIDFSCKAFPYIIRHFYENNPTEISCHPFNFHQYSCPSCKINFPMKAALELHKRNAHPERTIVNCPLCEQEFPSKEALNYHTKKFSLSKHSLLRKKQLTNALCLVSSCVLDKEHLNGRKMPPVPNYDYYWQLRGVRKEVCDYYHSEPLPDASDSDSSQSS